MNIEIDESDRQMIIRGLAVQAILSPGFSNYCEEISEKFDGVVMYKKLKVNMEDLYKRSK